MLEILPVEDKVLQESICLRCGINFNRELWAYAAYRDGVPVGICQFTVKDDEGILFDLATNDTLCQRNVLFPLGIAVLNFLDICGVFTAKCECLYADSTLLSSLGFSQTNEEKYEARLRSDR